MRWINAISLLWLSKAAGNLRELLCSFQYWFNGLLRHRKAPQNMLWGTALLPCSCSAKTQLMPLCLPLQEQKPFLVGATGVLTCWGTASCLHEAVVTPSPGQCLWLECCVFFGHGVLREGDLWAAWCALPSKVTVVPERGDRATQLCGVPE